MAAGSSAETDAVDIPESWTAAELAALDEDGVEAVNDTQRRAVAAVRALCAKELAAVAPFKEVVGDLRILQFLRGHKCDVREAAEWYAKFLQWRVESGADAVREKVAATVKRPEDLPYHAEMMQYLPYCIDYGRTKAGDVLSIDLTGEIAVDGIVNVVPRDHFWTWHWAHMEYRAMLLQRLSEEQGRCVKVYEIRDLNGLGTSHISKSALDMFGEMVRRSQDIVPETLAMIVGVNVPLLFKVAWQVLRPLLREATASRIRIERSDFKDLLLRDIDASVLPVRFGGTCTRPICPAQIRDDVVTQLKVPARDSRQLQLSVAENFQVLWDWRLDEHDIKYSVTFVPASADSEPMVLFDEFRGNSHSGSVVPPSAGLVTLKFDNTYSYTRGKAVQYTLSMSPVAGSEAEDAKTDEA